MRRYLPLAIGLAIGLLVGAALIVRAIEGPEADADQHNFQIRILADRDPVTGAKIRDDTAYTVTLSPQASRDGWDFGDRVAYQCAYVEHFSGGAQDFEVHYEMVDPYPVQTSITPQINDLFGTENQSTADCGTDGAPGGTAFDGSDHFPHGTSLEFLHDSNGDGLVERSEVFDRVDYATQCGTHYWVPGDEPGEAWLWIDLDGAADKLEHGDGLCGGGPGEPYAAARVKVIGPAEGVGYCVTDSMNGDLCSGVDEVPSVTLGAGVTELVCSDGTTPEVTQTDPLRVVCP